MKSAFVRHFFFKCRGKGCNKIYFDKHYIKSESVKIKVYFFSTMSHKSVSWVEEIPEEIPTLSAFFFKMCLSFFF